jgi:predicted nucleotidyltransferase
MTGLPLEQQALTALIGELGDELYSCCLYGSVVRGDAREDVSDINLLIILRNSDVTTHAAVGRAIGANPRIDPFVLGLTGLERSVRAFAAKFASIKRYYRVLHGADPLATIDISPDLERFLCEQAFRNLRLRLARAFITRQQHRAYGQFLARAVTPLFLRLSEVLRLRGIAVPDGFTSRIDAIAQGFGIDRGALVDLLDFKAHPRELDEAEAFEWHTRTFAIVNTAVTWIEANWPATERVA